MKITNLVAVAALGLTASTAWAQNHPTAGAPQTTATVNGIFVPAPVPPRVTGFGVTVTAPPTTPVTVPPAPATASVTAGAPAAVASFTQSLTAGGVPAAAAQGVANSLQTLGSSPTLASVASAITAFNSAISSMTPAQVSALISTPQGSAAVLTLLRAYTAARAMR
jgi:hypothetical protein